MAGLKALSEINRLQIMRVLLKDRPLGRAPKGSQRLVNGMTYYYVLSALKAEGEGGNSTQVSARTVSTAPVQLTFGTGLGAIQLAWPANHLGWRLQTQTNNLAVGLGTNWFDVAGSTATNSMNLPMDSFNGSVFYQLIFP